MIKHEIESLIETMMFGPGGDSLCGPEKISQM